MQKSTINDLELFYECTNNSLSSADDEQKSSGRVLPLIIWAHGWGQTHQSFAQLIAPLTPFANHISLDFHGFGQSPMPPEDWGTKNYADYIAAWIKSDILPKYKNRPIIWIGHSFGCRVGVQLTSHYPDLINKMVFIAGAGLKKKRPLHKKIYFYLRIRLFKALRRFVPEGALKDKLMAKFGSADYKSAGPLRKIFVRVVNEDLSDIAKNIQCPVSLIYGSNDQETPAEFGQRYSALMQNAQLHILDGQDHYSVLQNGRHPVIKIIKDFIS